MKRSSWKLPFIKSVLKKFKKIENITGSLNNDFKLKFRNSTIPTYLQGSKVAIHNGAWFLSMPVAKSKLGLKLGEFSITKRMDTQLKIKGKKKKKK